MSDDSRTTDDIALSDLQYELMQALWARGEASVADVAEAVAPSRGLAHTTVATLLTRLAARGAVRARREGRQLVYCAVVSESQVRRRMVSGLIERLFGGDSKALLAHLLNEREVKPGDLEKVQALLAKGGRRRD
jgi:predicted transcriptional regulator